MSKLYILLGRSASGKTTVAEELIERNFGEFLVSYTTREPREGEINGIDYHFVDNKEFEKTKMIASFSAGKNWHYGVSRDSLFSDNNLFFPVISSSYALEVAKEAKALGVEVTVIYLNIDREERIKRLLLRGDDKDSIKRRIEIEESEGDINPLDFKDFEFYIFKEPYSVEVYVDKIKEIIK